MRGKRQQIKTRRAQQPRKAEKKRGAIGLDAIIGIVHDPKSDVAERHDDYLWGEDQNRGG
jgi:hypothetical protein